jgi:hypothetical protein
MMINTYDVTHFYVDIVCHINLLIGLITYFDIENESRHFEFKWRDYESRHPFVRDSFWIKISLSLIFLLFTIFITKNK